MHDFSRKTLAALRRKGIRILGKTTLPGVGPDGRPSFSNDVDGYRLDDNGTFRVRTFGEVMALAN